MKIVQFQVAPDNPTFQSVILGLSDDGSLYYWHEVDSAWHLWGKS